MRAYSNVPAMLSGSLMPPKATIVPTPSAILRSTISLFTSTGTMFMKPQGLLLRIWSKLQRTIILITHDVDEAIVLGDRVYAMWLRPGWLKEQIDAPFPEPGSNNILADPQCVSLMDRVLISIKEELVDAARWLHAPTRYD